MDKVKATLKVAFFALEWWYLLYFKHPWIPRHTHCVIIHKR